MILHGQEGSCHCTNKASDSPYDAALEPPKPAAVDGQDTRIRFHDDRSARKDIDKEITPSHYAAPESVAREGGKVEEMEVETEGTEIKDDEKMEVEPLGNGQEKGNGKKEAVGR